MADYSTPDATGQALISSWYQSALQTGKQPEELLNVGALFLYKLAKDAKVSDAAEVGKLMEAVYKAEGPGEGEGEQPQG